MDIKYCDNCGAQLKEGYSFCGTCGKRHPEANGAGVQQPVSQPGAYWKLPENEPPKKKKNNGLVVGIVVGVLFVLAIIGYTGENYIQSMNSKTSVADTGNSLEAVQQKVNEQKEKIEYTQGILTPTSFESDFMGLKYTPAANWVLLTRDEMNAQLEQDDVTTWEMFAQNLGNGSNVMIGVEELPSENVTTIRYITSLKIGLAAEPAVTVDFISDSITGPTYTLCGESYDVLEYHATQSGVGYTQKMLLRKKGKYMIVIAASYADAMGDTAENILSGFSAY